MPEDFGVYLFLDEKSNVLYVGKAKNLKLRVASYFGAIESLPPKTASLVSRIYKISHILVESELEALLLEANLIKKYNPSYNVRWTDGKAYPFIKITVKDMFPAVLQVRKIDDPKAVYFGPYPNIGDVRKILKMIRRIFPYQSVKNHGKKPCLYHYLNLCPCLPAFNSEVLRRKYRQTIKMIIAFLEGKKEYILKLLFDKMKTAAKNENFEEAKLIKKQIDTINVVTASIRDPIEYAQNPNLLSDESALDINELKNALKNYGVKVYNLSRIECYDISNIQGKQATGSMVVAAKGVIDKSQYRLFKIRLKHTPDDVSMLMEVLRRRLKHREWVIPNLIIVDGGVNQVNAAKTVVKETDLKIPVIGLAKREEEIVIPKGHFKGATIIRLPRNSRALKLLQRLRDEAHRFALAHHRKLRRQAIFL